MQSQQKYFLYARKSTDVEDKQVLSIEAQIVELRKFAADNNLHIVDTIIEKQSAKIPGRKIFGSMLKRIEAGEDFAAVAKSKGGKASLCCLLRLVSQNTT